MLLSQINDKIFYANYDERLGCDCEPTRGDVLRDQIAALIAESADDDEPLSIDDDYNIVQMRPRRSTWAGVVVFDKYGEPRAFVPRDGWRNGSAWAFVDDPGKGDFIAEVPSTATGDHARDLPWFHDEDAATAYVEENENL